MKLPVSQEGRKVARRSGQIRRELEREPMLGMKIRQPALGSKIMRILRKHADQRRVVDQSRESVTRAEAELTLKAAGEAKFQRVRNRGRTRLELKDILQLGKRSSVIEGSGCPSGRLIEIQLPSETCSF